MEGEGTIYSESESLAQKLGKALVVRPRWNISRPSIFLALALFVVGAVFFFRLRYLLQSSSLQVDSLYSNVVLPFAIFIMGCVIILAIALIYADHQQRKIANGANAIEATSLVADLLAKLDEEHLQSFSSWLHDNIGHGLVLSRLDIEYFVRNGKISPEEAVQSFQHVDGMLAEVRSMASTLYPKLLSDVGLSVALESLIEHYSNMSHLSVDSAIGSLSSVDGDKDKALVIYRTIQECLTNAAKCGHTELVWVAVHEHHEKIHGLVLNHVKGGVLEREGGNSGIGLELMSARMRRFGGSLSIGWDGIVFKVEFTV